jgi:cell wall-associated NlpC family hydrolase
MERTHKAVRKIVAVGAAAAIGASLLAVSAPAAADTRSDYAAAKARLAQLRQQSDLLVDAYNGQNERVQVVTKQVEELERKVAELKAQVEATRGTLNRQAVSVYKYGSTQAAAGMVAVFSIRSVDEAPRAEKYLGEMQGETKRALEQFSASQADAEVQNALLVQVKAQQEALLRDIASKKGQIERSISQQAAITSRFKARLEAEEAQAQAAARARANSPSQQFIQQQARALTSGTPAQRQAAVRRIAQATGKSPAQVAKSIPASGSYASAIQYAMSALGTPYRFGASGGGAYDCSGLVQAAYKSVGKSLPRTSSAMAGLPRVTEPQPGDIAWRPGHVAIYVGNGQVINAPQTGDVVKYGDASKYTSFHRP